MSAPPNVAYVWSPRLEVIANELPANRGRSRMVHSLIRALDLVSMPSDRPGSQSGQKGNDRVRKARIVAPDDELATELQLRKYHDPRYVDYLLLQRSRNQDKESRRQCESGSESESDDSTRTRKKPKAEQMGLEHDCPPFPELAEYATLVAASTLTACRLLVKGEADIAIVWDGGRHHALRSQASGFCYVADVVLGILMLSREGTPLVPKLQVQEGQTTREEAAADEAEIKVSGAPTEQPTSPTSGAQSSTAACPPPLSAPPRAPRRPRVLYLDMDLHYGDGVAQAFASPTHYPFPLPAGKRPPRLPQVLTMSIHHQSRLFFPPGAPGLPRESTPHPFSLSLPLAAYANRETYARAWVNVERIANAWSPDYIVLQLGVDGLPNDAVGQYGAWSVQGEGSVQWVVDKIRAWRIPTLVLGGGGYDNANTARAWALATARLLGRNLPPESDVPEHPYLDQYAPSFTLEVPESHVPDETTSDMLESASRTFETLADRILTLRRLHNL